VTELLHFALLFPQVATMLPFISLLAHGKDKTMHFVNKPENRARRFAIPALSVAILLAVSSVSQAARIDVRTLTCQQAVSLVQTQGAIVFTLTDRTYDRIVRNRFLCGPSEYAEDVFTGTSDTPRCKIGKRCLPGQGPFNEPFDY